MPKFNIIQANPEDYKEQIYEFWREYLPGTPLERFKWMKDNPAGSAIWFFAFDEESNQLAGTISIMPREMILNGEAISAGIVGDFMISSRYRVFGPAIPLLKMVVENKTNLGFQFIYTIPNPASIKLAKRVGFSDKTKLCCLVKPINIKYYINKYLSKKLAGSVAWMVEQVLMLVSKETYIIPNGYFEEVSSIDEVYDVLWDKIKNYKSGLYGVLNSKYLYWRYFQNPLRKFRLLSYKTKRDGELLGYIIFSLSEKKITIYEIVTLGKGYDGQLLKKLIHIGRKEACQAIYINLSEGNHMINRLKRFLFVDARNETSILTFCKDSISCNEWSVFDGDRNI